MEALILVAKVGGPTMFARISVMRALGRRVELPAAIEQATIDEAD